MVFVVNSLLLINWETYITVNIYGGIVPLNTQIVVSQVGSKWSEVYIEVV